MANEKLDWFPLYWQRFKIGTFEMKADEVGAYILLLIYEWDKGFLPEDRQELLKISKVSDKKLEKVLKKFQLIENKYFNETLEVIRIEQSEKHAKNSERGQKGAKVKWENFRKNNAQAVLEQNLSTSIRGEEIREDERRNYIYIEGEKIFEIEKWFEEKLKFVKPNWQKIYTLANIDDCLKEFFLKKSHETFNDIGHFKNSFSKELQFVHDKNQKLKTNEGAKRNPAIKQPTTYTEGKGPGSFK
jgi:uncharacterized protein YdaU (DUF1376 family)